MKTIEFLQNLEKSNLSKIGHRKIYDYIKSNIRIPIPITVIKKGTHIFRGRSEKGVLAFNNEFDLSYRTDFANIVKYGRCNRPHQSVFYGSIAQNRNDYAPATVIAEIFSNFHTNKYITIGEWIVKEDFEVADIYFSNDYNKVDTIRRKQILWNEKLIYEGIDKEEFNQTLAFFCKQFSKKDIFSHWDYKISSVYFDLLIENKIDAVLYPSVRRDFNGYNIALIHPMVDYFLELKSAGVYELGKSVKPIFFTEDLGFMNSNFNWKKVKNYMI